MGTHLTSTSEIVPGGSRSRASIKHVIIRDDGSELPSLLGSRGGFIIVSIRRGRARRLLWAVLVIGEGFQVIDLVDLCTVDVELLYTLRLKFP